MGFVTTTARLQDYLTKLYAAREAVLVNKSYQLSGQTLSRADERWISDEIEKIEGRLSRRTNGSRMNVEIVR